eukprot:2503592-Pleurochrysis_carterae.AAC.3
MQRPVRYNLHPNECEVVSFARDTAAVRARYADPLLIFRRLQLAENLTLPCRMQVEQIVTASSRCARARGSAVQSPTCLDADATVGRALRWSAMGWPAWVGRYTFWMS